MYLKQNILDPLFLLIEIQLYKSEYIFTHIRTYRSGGAVIVGVGDVRPLDVFGEGGLVLKVR